MSNFNGGGGRGDMAMIINVPKEDLELADLKYHHHHTFPPLQLPDIGRPIKVTKHTVLHFTI